MHVLALPMNIPYLFLSFFCFRNQSFSPANNTFDCLLKRSSEDWFQAAVNIARIVITLKGEAGNQLQTDDTNGQKQDG